MTRIGPPSLPWRGLRGVDPEGAGGFGAPRGGGRVHDGLDFLALPGDDGVAPGEGTISHLGTAYGPTVIDPFTGKPYGSIHIQGTGPYAPFYFKILYVAPESLILGQHVRRGQRLGTVQNIPAYYKAEGRMKPHVHLVVRTAADPGRFLAALPEPILYGA